MKGLVKIIIGVIVIGGGIGFFMYEAMQSSWSYYYSVDEFSANTSLVADSTFRIAGKVKAGTIDRDIEKILLSFTLAGNKSEIPVEYKGIVPDNFTEDIEVVVEGRMDVAGVFQAGTLLTKCESKYEAKVN